MSKHTLITIPGFSGYAASGDGKIWSIDSNWRGYGARPLATELVKGYLKVRVYRDGKRVKQSVHKLVCLAFRVLAPSEKHEVRHLNGNRLHNSQANLNWGTSKENAEDRDFHGTTHRGPERREIALRAARISAEKRRND